jgi:hypothetical protein
MNLRQVCTSWALRIQVASRKHAGIASMQALDFAPISCGHLNQTLMQKRLMHFRALSSDNNAPR